MAVDYQRLKSISEMENKVLAILEDERKVVDQINAKQCDPHGKEFEEILQRYDSLISEVNETPGMGYVHASSLNPQFLGTLFGEDLFHFSELFKRVNGVEVRAQGGDMKEHFKCMNYTRLAFEGYKYFKKSISGLKAMRDASDNLEAIEVRTGTFIDDATLMLKTHIERTDDLIKKIEDHFGVK